MKLEKGLSYRATNVGFMARSRYDCGFPRHSKVRVVSSTLADTNLVPDRPIGWLKAVGTQATVCMSFARIECHAAAGPTHHTAHKVTSASKRVLEER